MYIGEAFRGCLKSPDSVIFHRLCFPIPASKQLANPLPRTVSLDLPGLFKHPLSSYQQGLEIRQKLAARDPANAQWKTDLVISLWKLASILERQGTPQKREAGVNYQRALEILRPLAAENRLKAEQKTWISQLEARLKAITEEPARGPNDN